MLYVPVCILCIFLHCSGAYRRFFRLKSFLILYSYCSQFILSQYENQRQKTWCFFKNCLRSTSSKWIPCCLFYFENMHNCNAAMNRDCSFRVSHRPNIYFRCLNPKGRGGGAENSFKHWEPAAARALNSQNISQVCTLADRSVSCMSKQRFDSEK